LTPERSADPSVSVVLCTFNGAAYVGEQIDSILAQTRPPDEIVIADDGSNDQTLEIATRHIARARPPKLPRVAVLEISKGLGVTGNFARALAAATADVVFLADQDDVWRRDKIERQLDGLARHPRAMLSVSNASLIGADGADMGTSLFDALHVGGRELAAIGGDQPTSTLVRRSVLLGMTFALRRPILESALPIPPSWPHDYWLSLMASSLGPISVTTDCLVGYRQHGTNVVGLVPHTFAFKLARVLHSERTAALYRSRFECLLGRLEETPDAIAEAVKAVEGKLRFEERRTRLHRNRARRSAQILAMTLAGSYSRYASNGPANGVRDAIAAGST
jgi:glycosyltransferase involved in cell wall biosynthesis